MPTSFRHEALPYAGSAEFVPSCVALLQEGLARDQRLMLVAAQGKIADVRDALGGAAQTVTFVPAEEHGRNPARITTILDSFQAAGDGRRSLGIAEWTLPGRSSAALAETQLAESLLNAAALQPWPLDVVCLYDSAVLTPDHLADVRRTHPYLRGQPDNADFRADLATSLFAAELAGPPGEAPVMGVAPDNLAEMRAFVRGFATGHGVGGDRAGDFVVAANEIVTNSLRHGGGACRVALWQEEGAVVCEVADDGRITDPLAGRLAPLPTATSGRGLWLANHLCDLVQIRSSEAGTVVRLYVDRL